MLLVVAVSCTPRALAQDDPSASSFVRPEDINYPDGIIPQEPLICCNAMDAKCEACKYNVTVEEICRVRKEDMALDPSLGPLDGCPTGTPTEEPPTCYSKDLKKEVKHGELGKKKCCWYGDWKKKSKCEKKTSHPDNCYSTIWNKEVMHGEMGAKKCCWKGDWESKSKCK